MPAIDFEKAPTFEQPTMFEKILDEFYRDMEDCHCQVIGEIDGGEVYAVTVELGYLAHWFDRLQWAYDEEKRTNDN